MPRSPLDRPRIGFSDTILPHALNPHWLKENPEQKGAGDEKTNHTPAWEAMPVHRLGHNRNPAMRKSLVKKISHFVIRRRVQPDLGAGWADKPPGEG
ncbi:MAG: hypothetical protein HYX86_06665 [Chloroflexi bacterium]|nr:hypothetical protein [Chloroflexota bacterium]